MRVTAARLHRQTRGAPWLSPRHTGSRDADLALLVVRPDELPDGIRACLSSGVQAVAALGPALAGTGATALDSDLLAACADAGVRLLGPDSAGLVNTDPTEGFDASTLPLTPRRGDVCLAGSTRRQLATVAGLLDAVDVGLSVVVGLGHAADIGADDVVAFADRDSRSRVTVICLDGPPSVGLGILPTGGRTTVVVYQPPGAPPHAMPAVAPGTIVTRSWTELADTVVLLLCQPRPRGREIAVVAETSAAAAAAESAVESVGLAPAMVTQHTEMRTRLLVPTAVHTGGLVVLPPDTDPVSVGLVLRTLADDPGVDAIICAVNLDQGPGGGPAPVLTSVSHDYPDVTIVSALPVAAARVKPRPGGVPALPDFRRAAAALANVRDEREGQSPPRGASWTAARPASSRAIGTRGGEQET